MRALGISADVVLLGSPTTADDFQCDINDICLSDKSPEIRSQNRHVIQNLSLKDCRDEK